MLCFVSVFPVKINAVNTDSAVFGISVNAFHAIVADFFRIEITPVAFAAADALVVIKDALSMFGHFPEHLPCPDYTTPSKGWSSLDRIELRTFTEEEYHTFFRRYKPDPMMDPSPFRYQYEQISRSYIYNHDGYRDNYEHFGIFMNREPVGSFQLKRIDRQKKQCEFGIILRDDSVKNKGIGTEAIRLGMKLAKDKYGIQMMIGDTMGRNTRMMRVFEKLGFSLAETVPDAFELPDGTKEDRYVYIKQLTEDKG